LKFTKKKKIKIPHVMEFLIG